MKKFVIILVLVLMPTLIMAQAAGGAITRPTKKTEKKVESQRRSINRSKTSEAAGYDVILKCNVPTAIINIDGKEMGLFSEEHFLKKGSHNIVLKADGYEDLSKTIVVSSSSTFFSFFLKDKEKIIPPIIQNLVNNMVEIEGGTFLMGYSLTNSDKGKSQSTSNNNVLSNSIAFANNLVSSASKNNKNENESDDLNPVHQVQISSFQIGKFEVSQEEWETVMGHNPSTNKGTKLPVENVSWDDCQIFISKLNLLTGKNFRLPTEAEWEYAAQGGNKCKVTKYAGSDNIESVAWYMDNSGFETHPVGQKSPNELGLYDMSGNVNEWCQDWFDNYNSNNQIDPRGPENGDYKVHRGGSRDKASHYCTPSYRYHNKSSFKGVNLGLRLAL